MVQLLTDKNTVLVDNVTKEQAAKIKKTLESWFEKKTYLVEKK